MKHYTKTFALNTLSGYDRAESYKAKHENNGARVSVTPCFDSLGNDAVKITATY